MSGIIQFGIALVAAVVIGAVAGLIYGWWESR